MKRQMEISQHCWKFIYKHSDIGIFAVCHQLYFWRSFFFLPAQEWVNCFTNKPSSSSIYNYLNGSIRRVKKIALQFRFYIHFFHVSLYVYSPWQRQRIHWGQNFDDNRKAFSLCPYVASFKIISSKSDFIHIFNDFIHVYSHGARPENPLGTNFWCQLKALITSTICCKFQTTLFQLWFYTYFFNVFPHVYSPGQGQTNLCGQNSDVNTKALSLCPSFKSMSLKSDFIQSTFFITSVLVPSDLWQSESAVIMISCYFDHEMRKRRTNVPRPQPNF